MRIVPPQNSRAEQITALARGLVQVVPFAGGLLAESINLWISPLEKRKAKWVAEVSSAINEICNDLSVLPESLAKDDRFFSFLLQATLIALKNHQEEKFAALRSAVTASVDTSIFSEDEGLLFLRYIDELTPTHMRLLADLNRHSSDIESVTDLEGVFSVIYGASGVMDRILFRLCLRDLASRSMVVMDDLADFAEYDSRRQFIVTDASGTRPLTLTAAGTRFLSFITNGSVDSL